MIPPAPTTRDTIGRLFTVAELAALWRCSTEHVYSLIRAKELPTVQLGRGDRNKLRIAARDVEAWIDANRSTSGATRLSRAG